MTASVMTSGNLNFAVDQLVSAMTYEEYFLEDFAYPLLFSVQNSTRPFERKAQLAGLTDYTERASETQSPTMDAITQQWEKDIVPAEYDKKLTVTRKMVDDDQWNLIGAIGSGLGAKGATTVENKCASVFNDAFDGAVYRGGDAKSLCNDAHTNADATNSQDNKRAGALSAANVISGRQIGRDTKDFEGELAGVRYDTMLVPNELEALALEISLSTGRPDTANNPINVSRGMYRVVVWDRLTEAAKWFMIDSRKARPNLELYWRVPLEIYGEGNLFMQSRSLGGYFRMGLGFHDWRWCLGFTG